MTKESAGKKKRCLLKVAGLCVIISAALLILSIAYKVNSSHRQYLESQKNVYRSVARQMNIEEPNVLTDSDFEKPEELQIILDGITTAEPLLKLKNLKLINFKYVYYPKLNINIDYEPLAKMQKLRDIRISVMDGSGDLIRDKLYEKVFPFLKTLTRRTRPFDLGRLKNLKQIESLSLSYSEMKNYEALAYLPNLRHLGLGRTTIRNPAFLKELSSLKSLFFSNVRINDITPISGLANLEVLTFLYTDINDLSSLVNLKNLKSLTLYSPKYEDINAVFSITNLETLDLSIKDIGSLDMSVSYPKLNELHWSITQVSDIKSIAKLTNLRMLNLRGLKNIIDFSPLAKLVNLQSLDISATQVSDIEPLEGLTKLQSLYLDGTNIKDISTLKKLINLKELQLQNCENITDQQIEDLRKALPDLKIEK